MICINDKYNMLTVVERLDNYVCGNAKFSKWRCLCECGNYTDVLGTSLSTGHTKSCGCLQNRHKTNDSDMLNKRFGRLTVISRSKSHRVPSGSVYDKWNCVCDCGRKTISFGRNLRKGWNKSCGCLRVENKGKSKQQSKAEIWCKDYLINKGITFIFQQTFPDLLNSNGNLLSYDFYLPDYNLLLELNGLQHYVSVDWFGGNEQLHKQQEHDKLKKNYATNHGFEFLIIDTNRISKKCLFTLLDKYFNEI